jgi:tryptophan synthase alpha chain
MNRIDQTFKRLKKSGQKALIGYITAGHPDKRSFQTLVPVLEKSGVDLLEVGVPFSDPIADGPTIQQSSQAALAHGATLAWILSSISHLRRRGVQIPLILMSYCNPVHAMGIETFFRRARLAGVDGLIIPDLIPEEAGAYARAARRQGIALIFLVAPTTPKARLRMIAGRTSGFLYAVAVTGVTGARRSLPDHIAPFLRSVKRATAKPVAVGFGLSTARQVRDIAKDADGVIIGSALIREIAKSQHHSYRGAARFARSLARALNPKKDYSHAS